MTIFHPPDETQKFIVNLDHAFHVYEVKDFLIDQPEVRRVSWEKQKFKGKHCFFDDDEKYDDL